MTQLLTYEQVAERLHCHVRTVRRLVAAGELRIMRPAKKPLVAERELEAYIAAAYRKRAS